MRGINTQRGEEKKKRDRNLLKRKDLGFPLAEFKYRPENKVYASNSKTRKGKKSGILSLEIAAIGGGRHQRHKKRK